MDGAPAMTGESKGMASMVRAKVRESRGEAVKKQMYHPSKKPSAPRQFSLVGSTTGNYKLSYLIAQCFRIVIS